MDPYKNAGKGQKTLTNHSKPDINDRVSKRRTNGPNLLFFGFSLGGKIDEQDRVNRSSS